MWNEVDLTGSVRRVDFVVPTLVRLDSNLPNPQLLAAGVMADFQVLPHLILTGGYLFADLPQRPQPRVHIPLVAATPIFRAARVRIADRNRVERLIGLGNSPVRYRNRCSVDVPLDDEGTWHAFADDEVFFDMSATKWSQNRFQIGGGARTSRSLSVDAFYLLRTVSGVPKSTRVLGTTLRVALHAPQESRR